MPTLLQETHLKYNISNQNKMADNKSHINAHTQKYIERDSVNEQKINIRSQKDIV